jgi:hypothetical protein
MSLDRSTVESHFEASGLVRQSANSKRVEYVSKTNGHVLYFIPGVGLPNYARLIIHPELDASSLLAVPGVSRSQQALHHGSTLTAFPKRIHTGQNAIPHGQALNATSVAALSQLSRAFSAL